MRIRKCPERTRRSAEAVLRTIPAAAAGKPPPARYFRPGDSLISDLGTVFRPRGAPFSPEKGDATEKAWRADLAILENEHFNGNLMYFTARGPASLLNRYRRFQEKPGRYLGK